MILNLRSKVVQSKFLLRKFVAASFEKSAAAAGRADLTSLSALPSRSKAALNYYQPALKRYSSSSIPAANPASVKNQSPGRDSEKLAKMTKLNYPKARRDESAKDVYHSTEVSDPYRWLEDPDSEETKEYVASQNSLTLPFINSCPKRQAIYERLKQLWDFPKYSCPVKTGDGKYYFFKNTGLQNQSVLYVQDTLDSEPRVFLDPNTFSEDGTVALTSGEFSQDGSVYAYALSSSGSDWNTIHFIETKTGKKYPEILEKIKWQSISWSHDNKGIFYCCYPDANEKADGSETIQTKHHKLCYHKLGTPKDSDVVVADYPEDPLMRVTGVVTDCGRWLIAKFSKECRDNLVYFAKLNAKEEITGKLPFTKIIKKLESDYEYIGNFETKAIFKTNKNAPNYKLISIDLENFKDDPSTWSDLIPEHSQNVLDWAAPINGDKLVLCYLEDVKNVLKVHDLESGKFIKQLPIDVGTISGFSGDKRYSEIFYRFTSFLTPGIIYRTDLTKDQEPEVFKQIKVEGFDSSLYKVKQVFYPSKDGTKIPMFIVSKKDIELDGSSPCLLYGYGGFNISVQPGFSVTRLVFLQHFNGVVAIPNIRGGGEYGEKWHFSGRLLNKQNVFDDFQSAAEYLINNRYTSPSKLVIEGASNGGLLVAACVNQRPDLFGAAVAHVGVMDMLKYHKFTIGYAWTSDYGSSEDPEHFKNLLKYSPLHNVKAPENGAQYPATLLLTGDHDDRVVPLHSLKLIATLQHELGTKPNQKNPLLVRVDVKSGHGGGKPTSKNLEESADVLSFILQTLNLQFKD